MGLLNIKQKSYKLFFNKTLTKQLLLCLLVAICLTNCIAIPVPTRPKIIQGKEITDSVLKFTEKKKVTKMDILEQLGPPTIWLEDQRTLVYGLRRTRKSGVFLITKQNERIYKSEVKEATFFILDNEDAMEHWGRAKITNDQTWMTSAIEWAQSKGIELPKPSPSFVEDSLSSKFSDIYFYRQRDLAYNGGFMKKPREKTAKGNISFVDIYVNGTNEKLNLIGQLRWKSYLKVRKPPGKYNFIVDSDTDITIDPVRHSQEFIELELEPGCAYFIEVVIEKQRRTNYGPNLIYTTKIIQNGQAKAIEILNELPESW